MVETYHIMTKKQLRRKIIKMQNKLGCNKHEAKRLVLKAETGNG